MIMKTGAEKLLKLRELMKAQGLQAYIVPYCDAHQSEYLRLRDQRVKYISGFSGSAGTVVLTADKALLWTDGRYFNQAVKQFDPPGAWTLMKDRIPGTPTVETWLASNLPKHSTIASDPTLLSHSEWNTIQTQLHNTEHIFKSVDKNLVDLVWGAERPAEESKPVVPQLIKYSGEISGSKMKKCFGKMKENDVHILVVTALDEVAYLLNWRGSDISFNPVFISYLVLVEQQVHIFIHKNRLTPEAEAQLKNEKVDAIYHPYEEVHEFLSKISKNKNYSSAWIASSSSHSLHMSCEPLNIQTTVTPGTLMKLIKNDSEIQGMKVAHIKDAVAIVKYFAWLEEKVSGPADKRQVVTEISGAAQLEKFRHEQENYAGQSFDTISAIGPHAAIIHYQPEPSTDAEINNREFYLCDCGSQFPDGTTDVTRTLHFGEPNEFERECFTLVFKGQNNLARSKFPAFIVGNYLDTLARKSMWDVGLDYLHGTGHGVGSHLCVHEYPTMISWKPYPNDPGVQPGMFLSNEPGYYEDDKFGIRLENVEMIVKTTTKYQKMNRKFLTFETVTLVPYQTKNLIKSMLTDEEIQSLNDYHKKCYTTLKPLLQGPENAQALKWLEKETQPISR